MSASCLTCEHLTSCLAQVSASCLSYVSVMSHICRVARVNCVRDISVRDMSVCTHVHMSGCTRECVMVRMRSRHVSRMVVSCLTYGCVMSHM